MLCEQAHMLKKFDDSHFRRFLLVAMIVAGGVLAAQAAFAYYFVPITPQQYLQFETYFPVATLVGLVAWTLFARADDAAICARYLAVVARRAPSEAPPAARDLSPRAGAAVPARAADDRRVVRDRGRSARSSRGSASASSSTTRSSCRPRRSCSRSPARSTSSCGIATCCARCSRT